MEEASFFETLVPIYWNIGTYLPNYMAFHPKWQWSDYITLPDITSEIHTIMFVIVNVTSHQSLQVCLSCDPYALKVFACLAPVSGSLVISIILKDKYRFYVAAMLYIIQKVTSKNFRPLYQMVQVLLQTQKKAWTWC